MDKAIPSSYTFSFEPSGRCGIVRCSKENEEMEIWWEMPGRGKADILLAPLDLKEWKSGRKLPREEQISILEHLRDWLSSKKINADIDPPSAERDPEPCVMAGCCELRVRGSAYCPNHLNEALLRK